MLCKTTDSSVGISGEFEDEFIKIFGSIPFILNTIPRAHAELLYKDFRSIIT